METITNLEQQNVALEVTENSKIYLQTAASWSKFLAILSFVGLAIAALAGIVMIPFGSYVSSYAQLPFLLPSMGSVYIMLAVIMFFPTLFLYRFSQKTTKALAINNATELEEAFNFIKRYWKFKGILAIIYLGWIVFLVPIAAIMALAAR